MMTWLTILFVYFAAVWLVVRDARRALAEASLFDFDSIDLPIVPAPPLWSPTDEWEDEGIAPIQIRGTKETGISFDLGQRPFSQF